MEKTIGMKLLNKDYLDNLKELDDNSVDSISIETKEELFDLLYSLENEFNYDETSLGLRISLLINKLQKELL
jgi:hypothetical protein